MDELTIKTIHFQDEGQDFTRWEVVNGIVVAAYPFQGDIWKGTRVVSAIVGRKPSIRPSGSVRAVDLIYKVVKIESRKA